MWHWQNSTYIYLNSEIPASESEREQQMQTDTTEHKKEAAS